MRLLSVFGLNELSEKGKKKAWLILLAQVKEIMILILLAAGVLIFIVAGMISLQDAA